jgi:hypothetical protein
MVTTVQTQINSSNKAEAEVEEDVDVVREEDSKEDKVVDNLEARADS